MLKVEVGIFRRGTSDEQVLNSIANFNIAVKACGLEAVFYSERIGTVEEEDDLATLLGRFVSKDHLRPGHRVNEGRVWRARWIR